MQLFKLLGLLILASVLVVAAMVIYTYAPRLAPMQQQAITNFDECVAVGNAVMESYPRQCRTADGRLFVEEISSGMPVPPDDITFNGCAVAGCSQQLCVSVEEAPTIITTCEYRDEYMCYAEASCEPQADGKCGWTQTPAMQQCLANPPEMEPEVQ